jgi:hypothetical protein
LDSVAADNCGRPVDVDRVIVEVAGESHNIVEVVDAPHVIVGGTGENHNIVEVVDARHKAVEVVGESHAIGYRIVLLKECYLACALGMLAVATRGFYLCSPFPQGSVV